MFEAAGYYYFFSTISQTFGAILGVVGLFAVFKLERIRETLKQKIKRICFDMTKYGQYPQEVRAIYKNEDKTKALLSGEISLESILSLLEQTLNNHSYNSDLFKFCCDVESELLRIKQIETEVKSFFRWPLIITAVLIFCSLITLPFGKYLGDHKLLGPFAFLLFCIVSASSLWLTVQSVKRWVTK